MGEGTTITLIDAKRPAQSAETSNPAACSEYLGLDPYAAGMVGWDVFDALLTPGDLILLPCWRGEEDAVPLNARSTCPKAVGCGE